MSLKKLALQGIAWNSLGTIGAGVVNIFITMVLARMLTPYDFGILELLIVFSVLSEVFVDSGFSQAIIRDNNASNEDLTSVFYFNVIIAVVLYCALYAAAPLIANFYKEDSLVTLSRFIFLTIILSSLSLVQNANYTKNLNFKTPAVSSLAAMIITGVVAIIMAYKGFGVWALAVNLVLYSFLKTVFLWIQSDWRPKGWLKIDSIKKYFAFSGNLLAQGLVDKFVTNLEPLLIGRFFSKYDLGLFSQGRKLNSYITLTSTGVIQKVTYPVLSKLGSDKDKLKEGYRKIIGLTMFVMMPAMLGVAASADNLIVVAFGKQWLEASPYLRMWAFVGLFVALYSFFTNIFLVLGKSRLLLCLSLIRQAVRVLAIVLLINTSVINLMWGIVVVTILSSISYIYFGGRLINYSLIELLKDLSQIILSSLIGSIFIYVLDFYLKIDLVIIKFIMQLFLMVAIYLIMLIKMKNKQLIEFKNLAKNFLPFKI